jgi:hypothetical protein
MLIPREDYKNSQKKLKRLKKINLELYKKSYGHYHNEFILSERHQPTNLSTISHIKDTISYQPAPQDLYRGKLGKFQVNPVQPPKTIFEKYDFSYHQSVNITLNERMAFHLSANLASKNDFGIFSLSPSFSYHSANYYY